MYLLMYSSWQSENTHDETNLLKEYCIFSCIQAGHLKTHMMTHTGEKNYTCQQCANSCNQAGTLKTHMMTQAL